jgi:hypothetical protein
MRRVCVTMRETRVGRQCLCVRTGSKPRTSMFVHWRPTFISRMNRACPLTPHVHITHEPCTYHIHSTDNHRTKVIASGTFAQRACLDALRQWIMRRMFVEYCTIFGRMRRCARYVSDSSVINFVTDTCAVHAWFVSDFYPRRPEKLVNFSTHKPNLCVICEWFVRFRTSSDA